MSARPAGADAATSGETQPLSGQAPAPAPMRCCCGSVECVYLQHNCSVLETVEKDVHQAARMGQVSSLINSLVAPSQHSSPVAALRFRRNRAWAMDESWTLQEALPGPVHFLVHSSLENPAEATVTREITSLAAMLSGNRPGLGIRAHVDVLLCPRTLILQPHSSALLRALLVSDPRRSG